MLLSWDIQEDIEVCFTLILMRLYYLFCYYFKNFFNKNKNDAIKTHVKNHKRNAIIQKYPFILSGIISIKGFRKKPCTPNRKGESMPME